MKLRLLCDSVFEALDTESEQLDEYSVNNIVQVLRETENEYNLFKKQEDVSSLESLSKKLRKMLIILRLIPLELKIAMTECSYGSILRDFLTLYLNVKVVIADSSDDADLFINDTIRELFLLLGKDDARSIWSVIAKSVVFENSKFLDALIDISFHKTHKMPYTYEQYITMLWVLYMYLSIDGNSEKSRITKCIETFKPPKDIIKYIAHHFHTRDWTSYTDFDVHKFLFTKPQPKSFVRELRRKIGVADRTDTAYNGCDLLVFEDESLKVSVENENVNDTSGARNKRDASDLSESKVNGRKKKEKKKKKKQREEKEKSKLGDKKIISEKDPLEAFYASVTLRDPIIELQRVRM